VFFGIFSKFYLQSFLYYMETQKNKPILKHKIWVKHYDDLINDLSSDIINSKVIENNIDFSKSLVEVETCLTESELKNKIITFSALN